MDVLKFDDVKYLQRVVVHLYDILDDISSADDMCKSDDEFYRKVVGKLQKKKNDSGVESLDGYTISITPKKFLTKDEVNEK